MLRFQTKGKECIGSINVAELLLWFSEDNALPV
jgi:hypothetical protein